MVANIESGKLYFTKNNSVSIFVIRWIKIDLLHLQTITKYLRYT